MSKLTLSCAAPHGSGTWNLANVYTQPEQVLECTWSPSRASQLQNGEISKQLGVFSNSFSLRIYPLNGFCFSTAHSYFTDDGAGFVVCQSRELATVGTFVLRPSRSLAAAGTGSFSNESDRSNTPYGPTAGSGASTLSESASTNGDPRGTRSGNQTGQINPAPAPYDVTGIQKQYSTQDHQKEADEACEDALMHMRETLS